MPIKADMMPINGKESTPMVLICFRRLPLFFDEIICLKELAERTENDPK